MIKADPQNRVPFHCLSVPLDVARSIDEQLGALPALRRPLAVSCGSGSGGQTAVCEPPALLHLVGVDGRPGRADGPGAGASDTCV